MGTKILLDTDIDILGDIDDALCLAYLLAQPACELIGITTVSYDTERRAMVASALCKAARKEIPILPGASVPLLAPLPRIEGIDTSPAEEAALRRWEHESPFPRSQAIDFMRRAIHDNPGEVTLLAIGPLTNVALLFAVDPETPALLRSLVMMGGAFTAQGANNVGSKRAEWNAGFDPHATAMVYRAPVKRHRSVGLDVTEQIKLDEAGFRQRFSAAQDHPLHEFVDLWFRHRPAITFHDPLAAATIFDDRICRFAHGSVKVDLDGAASPGTTIWTAGGDETRHEVAVAVDRERFLDHYFEITR
jgi:purine nucleosidase